MKNDKKKEINRKMIEKKRTFKRGNRSKEIIKINCLIDIFLIYIYMLFNFKIKHTHSKHMLRQMQSRYLGTLNQIQSIQRQIVHYQQAHNYRKTIQAYQNYIDLIKGLNNPKYLINAYIQMAQYCEYMEDRLLATDLYREVQELMRQYKLPEEKIQNINQKISALKWY